MAKKNAGIISIGAYLPDRILIDDSLEKNATIVLGGFGGGLTWASIALVF
jgi:3-oxoacyl-[acyl-carrier-protein] synthase III